MVHIGQFVHQTGGNFVHLIVATVLTAAFVTGHLLVARMAQRGRDTK